MTCFKLLSWRTGKEIEKNQKNFSHDSYYSGRVPNVPLAECKSRSVTATAEECKSAILRCKDCQRQRVIVLFGSLRSDVKLPDLEAQEFVCLMFASKGSEEACGLANRPAVRTNCRPTATDKSPV
jgi:hypothetical protein